MSRSRGPRRWMFRIEVQIILAAYLSWSAMSLTSSTPLRNLSLSSRQSLRLFAGDKKNLSASEREQRDEERRRRERRDDVVIGKTSAKQEEKDFSIDSKITEQEWQRSASKVEQEVFRATEEGMDFLNSLKLAEANVAFDRVFELRPKAYLWQAGIVKYYLGDLQGAADIFARNAVTFESKFGGPASEERIWLDACELKLLHSMSRQERKGMEGNGRLPNTLGRIPENDPDDMFSSETRKVIKTTRDLFSASLGSDLSGQLLARAKLYSIGGSGGGKTKQIDRKNWKLNSWFYLGLHHDAFGEADESKKCMKMALRLCPSSGKSDDIIHTLPLLHMSVRDWFDDDDFELDPMAKYDGSIVQDAGFSPSQPSAPLASMAYADPIIEASIKEGVSKLRLQELREALRLRDASIVGSKDSLQERLFYSLMDDAGFNSGFAP